VPGVVLWEVLAEACLLISGAQPGLDTGTGVGIARSPSQSGKEERMEGLAPPTKGMQCSFCRCWLGFGVDVEAVPLIGFHKVHGACPGQGVRE
jgi:hypothetical protein